MKRVKRKPTATVRREVYFAGFLWRKPPMKRGAKGRRSVEDFTARSTMKAGLRYAKEAMKRVSPTKTALPAATCPLLDKAFPKRSRVIMELTVRAMESMVVIAAAKTERATRVESH